MVEALLETSIDSSVDMTSGPGQRRVGGEKRSKAMRDTVSSVVNM